MRWWQSQSIKRMVAAALTLSIPAGANGQATTSTLDSAAAEARMSPLSGQQRSPAEPHEWFFVRVPPAKRNTLTRGVISHI